MIILDTNVVSALMRRDPDPVVIAWLDRQPSQSVWVTAVTIFELRLGIELLPQGRRRQQLEMALELAVADDLEGRVLAFEEPAAARAATISARRRRTGRPVDLRDIMIAGIVASRRATLATRNTRHFDGIGIDLIDPWASSSFE